MDGWPAVLSTVETKGGSHGRMWRDGCVMGEGGGGGGWSGIPVWCEEFLKSLFC